MSNSILSEVVDGIYLITLNRPEKKNAFTQAMYRQLKQEFIAAAENPSVRVLLLRGAGGVFSAGNDMNDFSSRPVEGAAVTDTPATQLMKIWIAMEKPVIAAVSGFAVGIGATCLPHCDLVIAARSTVFRLPFNSLGLVPEFGSTLTLLSAAGRVKASHYLLTGDKFDAQVASELGLVSQVCDDDQLEDLALQTCQRLAALSPAALRATKKLINSSAYQQQMLAVIENEMVLFRQGRESAEHKEAVAAFIEKRPADFSPFE
ncbi:MAG: enoyl-CoA hydratase-related protein [Gammaproteobacteria bacterium]